MDAERAAELAGSLAALRARVDAAAAGAGRDPAEIELLPVTKFFPSSDIVELVRLGCAAFGESREQEANAKVAELAAHFAANPAATAIRWHMIGSIQRKKARAVAGWAYAAHSVDSGVLIGALGRAAAEALGSVPYYAVVVAPESTLAAVEDRDSAANYLPGAHPTPTQDSLDAAGAILEPCWVWLLGIHAGDTVVDWDAKRVG